MLKSVILRQCHYLKTGICTMNKSCGIALSESGSCGVISIHGKGKFVKPTYNISHKPAKPAIAAKKQNRYFLAAGIVGTSLMVKYILDHDNTCKRDFIVYC